MMMEPNQRNFYRLFQCNSDTKDGTACPSIAEKNSW